MSLSGQWVSPKANPESKIRVQGHEGVGKWWRKGGQPENNTLMRGLLPGQRGPKHTRHLWDTVPLRGKPAGLSSIWLILRWLMSLQEHHSWVLHLPRAQAKHFQVQENGSFTPWKTERGRNSREGSAGDPQGKLRALKQGMDSILSVHHCYIPSTCYSAWNLADA